MKQKILLSIIFVLAVVLILPFVLAAMQSVTITTPINTANSSANNISFLFVPNSSLDTFKNASLMGNFSGTWGFNQTNRSAVVNQTSNTIYTVLPDGYYEWNVYVCDSDDDCAMGAANFTLTVDNTTPSIVWGTNIATNNTFVNRNWIFANVTVSDTNPQNLSFTLYNSTGSIINQTNLSGYGTTSLNWTSTTLTDLNEQYTYTVSATDIVSHTNTTSTYYLTLDNTTPSVSLSSPANLAEDFDGTVTFTYIVTETNPANCSLYLDNVLDQTDTSITADIAQTFTKISPTQADALDWYISCKDNASNSANSAIRYLDTYNNPGGSSSGGGSASSASATVTLSESGTTKTFSEGNTWKFKVLGQQHSMFIKEVTANYTDLVFRSDPINLRVYEGKLETVDVDKDGVKDFSVQVLDIDNYRRVKMEIRALNQTSTTRDTSGADVVVEQPVAGEVLDQEPLAPESSSTWWIWLIVIVVIIIIIVVIFALKSEKNPYEMHKPLKARGK